MIADVCNAPCRSETSPESPFCPGCGNGRQRNDKPGFVEGVHFSGMQVARHLLQPTRRLAKRTASLRRSRDSFCMALLPMGFTEPAGHPAAGALLPHRFTLTTTHTVAVLPLCGVRRFAFCCTFPILADGGSYPQSCPVEPGLSSECCHSANTCSSADERIISASGGHGGRRFLGRCWFWREKGAD